MDFWRRIANKTVAKTEPTKASKYKIKPTKAAKFVCRERIYWNWYGGDKYVINIVYHFDPTFL